MKRFALALCLSLICLSLPAKVEIKSQWKGARVAFLGDSITDERQIGTTNDTYWNLLQGILGIKAYPYGRSGHRMNQIVPQGEKLEAEHGQDVDAIIVFVGTNDYNGGIPMGQWYSYDTQTTLEDNNVSVERKHRSLNYDEATFKGRTNSVIRWLKTHYPTKQIIFFTPLHRGYATFGVDNIQPAEDFANAEGLFIDDYVQAIKEAANIWGVPVIDLNSLSGMNPMIDGQATYFRNKETDRLHPNTPGHVRLAYVLAYQLLGYPARF